MALLAGSPALNAGTATGAPTTDQRGVPRTGGINIGAYQASASILQVTGFPSSVTAGSTNTYSVKAVDLLGELAPGYGGKVHFSSSDGQAALQGDAHLTNGSGSFNAILKTAGTQSLTATDTANSPITGTQTGIVVNPASTSRLAVLFPLLATAGTPSSGTVKAIDAYGNLTPAYNGTVHFTSTDPQASLPADTTLTGGSATVSVTLKTAGTQAVTATDRATATITGTQSGIVVRAAAASSLAAAGFPSSVTAGGSGAITVTLKDAYGNVATGYTGTVHISSSDPHAVLAPDQQFTAADQGTRQFGAILVTAGTQSLTARDTANGSLTGTQAGITVTPAAAVLLSVAGFPAPLTAGTAGAFTVTLTDLFGNTASGYRGTAHFRTSDPQAVLPADYTFTAADGGTHTFSATFKTAGSQTLTAADTVNGALTGGIAASFSEFTAPTANSGVSWITAGPDGNLWFTELLANKVGNLTPAGVITEYSVPTPSSNPGGITVGPDGNLWFTELLANKVGKLTPAGVITEDPVTTPSSNPEGITAGPDGNLWFTEPGGNKIGKITPAGTITEYASLTTASSPTFITAGPDGNLWFTEGTGSRVGKITPAGAVTEYFIPTANSFPDGITAGPDGSLWFTENRGNKVGKITPAGAVTEYPIPTGFSNPGGITVGPDGLWFTEETGNKVGTITLTGAITEYPVPSPNAVPVAIVAGPDGKLWFTEFGSGKLGRLSPGIIVTPAAASTLGVAGFPASVTAGTAANVTVTARDAYGNTATGYTGTGHFTSSDPQAVLPTNYHFTAADQGTHTFSATLNTPGTQSLTATDTANSTLTGTQTGITVMAGRPTALSITGFPASVTAGTAGTFTVTLFDASGHIAAGYRGTVHFTSSDPQAVLPADYTLTAADAGVHAFSATLKTAGAQTLTGTDTVASGLTGTWFDIGEFTLPTTIAVPDGITTGPDGNLWFPEQTGNKIDKITPAGVVTEYSVPTANSTPYWITAGPDSNLWFTEIDGDNIGRITPAGVITEYSVPTAGSSPEEITAGPDGNLWFTEQTGNKVGKITPAGVITEFAIPTANSDPEGIIVGPDGNLWFTECNTSKVGKITLAGVITEYTIPTANSDPDGITAGLDGNLWFTEFNGNNVGRITPAGVFTEYPLPHTGSAPFGITVGPDRNPWFAEHRGNRIGRITPAGAFTEYPVPTVVGQPFAITTGPDGALWFTTLHKIGRLNPAISVTPAALDHFAVTTSEDGSSAVAGTPFDVTVVAQDAFNNTVTGYTGTVHFSNADPFGATLPADYTFTAADGGVHTFAGGATLYTAGTWDITATDTTSGITGAAHVNVVTAGLDHLAVSTSVDGGSTVAGNPFDVTVIAQDVFNNTVTTYTGTVHFSSGDPFGATLPADYTFQPTDRGRVTFPGGATLYTAGIWDVTVTDTASGLSGTDLVTVTGAPAVAFQIVARASTVPGAAFDVTVLAVDAYGNIDTDYTGTVHFSTTDGDAGVVLPTDYTFQLTDAGVATFPGGVTLVTPGDQILTVTDTASGITGSATVTVGNMPPSPPPGGGGGAAANGTPAAGSFVPTAPGTASPISPVDMGRVVAIDLVFGEWGYKPAHRGTSDAWILDPLG
jgi:streptogramin lyase